ncbi:MAG TPA: RnfABCDGE type electron transport complex subunit B, partial [Planctomycetes bacterium]|nr:RnfABCDGE type electron transport complex subunit B [Planctomycetota bacterium]
MTPVTILTAAGTMLVLAVAMALVLGWANRAFHVETDPRVEAAEGALPGANCGGCGYVGCSEYAEAVVLGGAPVDLCPVGGASTAGKLAEIMGVGLEEKVPERPVVHCNARLEDRLGRHPYQGEESCAAANMVAGVQGCAYGCLGFGDCVEACSFEAVRVVEGLAEIDYEKCVG